MFKDQVQRAVVCNVLMKLSGVGGEWWTPDGPTRAAATLLARPRTLDREAATLLQLAADIWHGRGLLVLDPIHRAAAGSLLIALAQGTEAIDGWIGTWARIRIPPVCTCGRGFGESHTAGCGLFS